MEPISPVYTVDLFRPLHDELIRLLRGLSPAEWERPTLAGRWQLRDVVAHLLDIGRDYTERWHHQMQIRDAVGAPLHQERRWLHPLLDLSVRALPHTYRETRAPNGTVVAVCVTGEAGGTWSLVRDESGWSLCRGAASGSGVVVRYALGDGLSM